MRFPTLFALIAALMLSVAAPLAAQGLFSPAITVNDRVITGYELEQRQRFVELLRAPGDPAEVARQQLIEERLKLEAASAQGIVPGEEEIIAGMEEFAGRANLTREEFVQALAAGGVAEASFREFVEAGLAWRELVRARFAGRVQISEAEIDRALSGAGGTGGVRVLLSEIIMPAPAPQAEAVNARARRISQITSEAAFSAEARRYSATPSRANGGRLPWRNINDLPPALRPIILALAPGEVTDPLPIPDAVALFQLRAIEETDYAEPDYAAIDYATYLIPGGRSAQALAEAQRITDLTDRCDDLYGIAKGQPEERLTRISRAPGEIPQDIGIELAKLDPGETSAVLTRGDNLLLVMMCGRTAAVNEDTAREDVVAALRNRRITAYADGYLQQLLADARIVER